MPSAERGNGSAGSARRLDRITRRTQTFSQLLEDGYSIRAADMPGADDLMMRIYAAMAQKERELISERTCAALAAAKARGRVLGGNRGWQPAKPPCARAAARERAITADRYAYRLTEQLASLQTANAGLQRELAQTQEAKDALQRRYAADIPNGRLAELYALMADRLRAGVTEDRVAQALRDAEALRSCDGLMTRKRFLIQTAGQTPDRAVSLLDGLIQISATAPNGSEGLAKATTVGIVRAWTVEPITLTGLPVRQPIRINNLLLTLVVEASDLRGYGMASLSTCSSG